MATGSNSIGLIITSASPLSTGLGGTGNTTGTSPNATNASTVSTSTNATFFPLFVASSSNTNQAFNLGTGLGFNPSTNTLTTTTFSGALSGNATSATSAIDATNAANVATTAVSTNSSFYPLFVSSNAGGNRACNLGTGLSFNPNTNILTTTTFSGALNGNATSATSAINATNATLVATTSVTTNATFYPLFVASSSNINQSASLNTGLNINPSTGNVNVSLLTINNGSSALSGINYALTFNSALSDGTYINFGGGGRSIGQTSTGLFFHSSNLDWNGSTNSYVYATTAGATLIELGTTVGSLKYASSGTAGSNAGPVTALSWSSTNGLVTIPGVAASKGVFTDSLQQLTEVGVLGFSQGGLGFASATTGDIIYASGSGTIGKLTAVAAGQVLASAGTTAAPAYTADPSLSTLTLIGASALTITSSSAPLSTENAGIFRAKNSAGTYENWMWPRHSDNITYMNFGASGYNLRTNGGVSTIWADSTPGVSFFDASPSFGGGAKVIFLANAGTAPTSNPTGGGIMYTQGGAGKWRGTGGTVTTFGPADPHCPVCESDFGLEWENEKYGGNLRICIKCFSEDFGKKPYIRWNE